MSLSETNTELNVDVNIHENGLMFSTCSNVRSILSEEDYNSVFYITCSGEAITRARYNSLKDIQEEIFSIGVRK